MTRISAATAVEAIQDWGVNFRPWGTGWASRTTAGGWDPVGIAHHHTGGSGVLQHDDGSLGPSQRTMLNMLAAGRPDLDGPLNHFSPVWLGKGRRVVFGIGWGNCNHAGFIDNDVARALRAGTFAGGGRGGAEQIDGNALLYGLEYLHPGDATSWPDELLDAGHRTAAALSEAHGWKRDHWAGSNAEHRELTVRKVDRSWGGWGDGMRRRIAELSREGTEPEWVRTERISEAIRKLRAAADNKREAGHKAQAAALKQAAEELAKDFPPDGPGGN